MRSNPPLTQIAIDQAAAGTNELVAAEAGVRIVVVNYSFSMSGAGTARFATGARNITGDMKCVDGGGAAFAGTVDEPALIGDVGQNLSLTTVTAFADGHLLYYKERP